ncbi:MAG: glycoside hydrolase family 18 protein [Burkholderiales bacterium]|nr:glycoside hydrolase family 18 protein [Burkholderiales bacterium]
MTNTSFRLFGFSSAVLLSAALAAATPSRVGSYFTQWGIYGAHYTLHNLVASGSDRKLTFLNYAFGNVYANGQCGMVSRPDSSATHDGGDAYADYQLVFKAEDAVDGKADTASDKLRGNFGQLRKLKARDPALKVLISLGGWSWSGHFSSAAATDESRRKLVASCIELYIRGNLPVAGGAGGPTAAQGVFDGIDIDWEFPGGGGAEGNSHSPDDKHNYTLLLAEFRRQLDALGEAQHRHYYLSAAVSAGFDHIAQTEPAEYSRYLDWVNVMTYDFHGTWDKTTNFVSPLYHDPADPGEAKTVVYDGYDAIQALLAAGLPRDKVNLGLSFFAVGWKGVPDGGSHGLYQPASGLAPGKLEPGNATYGEMKQKSAPRFRNEAAQSVWTYDGNEFWTYDDPVVIAAKVKYVKEQHLGGLFSWSVDGDDAEGSLVSAMGRAIE